MAIRAESMPISIRAAIWWHAHGFRGRGVVPRLIGRLQPSDRTLFIKTRHGAALSVDYSNFDIYATIHNNRGRWEAHVQACCERVLRPRDVFFDIGSSAGLFTLDCAKTVPALHVVAFEPQPTLAEHIRRSVQANNFKNIQVFEVMLGQEDGEGILFLTSHSIHASVIPREEKFQKINRRLRTLDRMIQNQEIPPPDVIKIDVEGSEMRVLKGAEAMLKTYQPSIVFEADVNMDRMGNTADDFFTALTKSAAYSYFSIEDDGKLSAVTPPYRYGNFLALSPRHADRL